MFIYLSRADCTVLAVQRAGMQLNHIDLSLKKYFPKVLMKYERPKMKRDTRHKCSLFLGKRHEKKTTFSLPFFHFWPFVFC